MSTIIRLLPLASLILASTSTLPAQDFSWAGVASGDWTDSSLWSPTGIPDATGETATIDAVNGSNYTVTLDDTLGVDAFSLNSAQATLSASGKTFTVDGPSFLDLGNVSFSSSTFTSNGVLTQDGGTLILINSTLNGSGSYQKNDGTLSLNTGTLGIAATQAGGSTTVIGNTIMSAGFTNQNAAKVTLNNGRVLTLNNEDFTNHGQFDFAVGGSVSTITSSTGQIFTNSPTGTLNVKSGGSTRRLSLDFDNQGQFNVNSGTQLNKPSGIYTNSGTITVPSSLTLLNSERFTNSGTLTSTGGALNFDGNNTATSLWENTSNITAANGLTLTQFEDIANLGTIDLTGGNLTVTLGGGNPQQFTNSGDIEIPPGRICTFNIGAGAGTVTLEDGSTLGGGGDLVLHNLPLSLGGAYSPGTSPLAMTNVTVSGTGSLTIDNGSTLSATSCTYNLPVTSHGTLTFDSNTFNDSFFHESDSVLTLNNGRVLTLNNEDFTNHGQFDFAVGGSVSTITSSTGQTFTNSPTGTLNLKSGGTIRRLSLDFDNQGQFNVNSGAQLNKPDGIYTNSGTITVPSSLTLLNSERFTNSGTLTSTGGALNFDGNNTATSLWENTSNITAANGLTLTQFEDIANLGTIDLTGGNLTVTLGGGNPQQFTNSGDIEIPPGRICTFNIGAGAGTVTLEDGSTLGGGGDLVLHNLPLSLGGAYSPGTSPLAMTNVTVSGTGSLTIDNGSTLSATSCTYNLPVTSHGTLTFDNNTFNDSFFHESDAVLTLNNGRVLTLNNEDFTNHGQFDFAVGGSVSTITSSTGQTFTNSPTGTLNLKSGGTIRRLSLDFDNQGQFNVNSGAQLNKPDGIYTNSGTITVPSSLTLLNSERFTNSGTLTSTGGALNFDGNNTATSLWENTSNITAANGLTLTQFEDIANLGTIDLTGGNLTVTLGGGNPQQFTNSGDIEIPPGRICTFNIGAGAGTVTLEDGSTLGGGGDLVLHNLPLSLGGAYSPGTSPLAMTNVTVSGTGSLTIDNGSTLSATNCTYNLPVTSHGTLTFDNNTFNDSFFHESDAVLTLNNGRVLTLNNEDFTNHGQFDFAVGGSVSTITSSTGQTFTNSPTGTLNAKSGGITRRLTLDFDNQGQFNCNSLTQLNLVDGIYTNSGTISALAQLLTTNIERFSNSGTLTSTGGALNFDGNNSATSLWENTGTVTITNGLTITGFENVTNSGTIAHQGGTVSVTLGTGNPQQFTNGGEIQVGEGLTFTLGNGGSGSTVTNDPGARLSGKGTFITATGNLDNDGIIAPGTSPGVLTFNTNIVNSATSEFEIEIASDAGAGTGHDQLVVNGNLALNGTLKPVLVGGYVPTPTDTFVIMSATGDITGTFANIQQPPPLVGTFNVTVDEALDQVILTYTPTTSLTYEQFQQVYFTQAQIDNGDADPNVDFDSDGFTNFAEWIHGQDPTDGATTVPILRIDDDDGPLDLTYAESRLLPEDAITVAIETTLDPSGAWDTIPVEDWTRHNEVSIPGIDNIQFVTLRVANAVWTSDTDRYFRLRFTAVEP